MAASLAFAATGCTIEARVGGAVDPSTFHSGTGGAPAPAPKPNAPPPPAPTSTPTPPAPTPPPRRVAAIPRPNTSGGGTTTVRVPIARNNGLFGGPNDNAALRGLVFFIPESTMTFPDVTQIKPSALVYTDTLNIDARDYTEGVAGTNRFEFYAIQYDGKFNASKAGTYTFWLNSSDGSKLYIDDKLVIDNDGRHVPIRKDGHVDLAAGDHTIRVDFFKAYRWVIALQLTVAVPGGTERPWSANL